MGVKKHGGPKRDFFFLVLGLLLGILATLGYQRSTATSEAQPAQAVPAETPAGLR